MKHLDKPLFIFLLTLAAALCLSAFALAAPAEPLDGAPAEETAAEVYITVSGKKYHRGSCAFLKKSKIGVTLQDAKSRGYTPCSKCKPPQ